jgi:hypothetical protein
VVASGELGNAPWPGSSALYWTELSMPAPTQPGMATFSVRFDAAGLTPPHRPAAFAFAVAVVPPPDCTLTLRFIAKEVATPIAGADIRVGTHRATTAKSGEAEVRLAKGRYELCFWKVGYEAPPRTVEIDRDMRLEIEAVVVPEENADRAWRA